MPSSPFPPKPCCRSLLPWSALGFISAEHLFQWLSLPLLSTAVRVKSRALSLDWNHLSHGPGLELISAEARVRYTAIPTPPLTRGAGEGSHRTTQMASTYYTASACQQKNRTFFVFFWVFLLSNIRGIIWTCSLNSKDICLQAFRCCWHLPLTVQKFLHESLW